MDNEYEKSLEKTYRRITLEKIKHNLRQYIGTELLESTQVDFYPDHIANQWVCDIKATIFGQKEKKEYIVKVPKDWWNHLKQSLGFKYKEKDIIITADHYMLFPDKEFVETDGPVVYVDYWNK